MFTKAIWSLCQVIEHTGDLTLLTDGERRYGGSCLSCVAKPTHRQTRTTKEELPKVCQSALKNKGSQRHRRGPKRAETSSTVSRASRHGPACSDHRDSANHLEVYTSLRRRCAAYRRRNNMRQKHTGRLQERLDVYWIVHNFVRVFYDTSSPGSGFRDSGPWLCAP